MKRIYTILFFVLFLSYAGFSQQEPQFSQYMMDNLIFNPADAGMSGGICANLLGRDQWAGIQGSPTTSILTLDAPIKILHGGIGLNAMYDKIGQFTDADLKLEYAYHHTWGEGTISGALQLGFFNKKVDFSAFHPLETGDPTLTPSSTQSSFTLDFGAGVFYQVKDKYYAGLSTSQVGEATETLGNASVKLVRHYYLTGGYHISLDNQGLPGFEVIPSALIKTDGVSTQFDINAMLEYNNKMWGGVSYRKQDAVVIILGIKPFGPGNLENLKIGYSYDIITSSLGSAGGTWGSHEIYLGYCFKITTQKLQERYKNVRFL